VQFSANHSLTLRESGIDQTLPYDFAGEITGEAGNRLDMPALGERHVAAFVWSYGQRIQMQ
jgi:hypothetical protein